MSLDCACSIGRRWPSYDTVPGLRLIVLVENRPGRGCAAAHGFAAWLEIGDVVVLVDTGPDPDLLASNARVLGLDLSRVEAVVLSHGHDDHSGGLPAVVDARRGRPLAVVMHPAATRPRYSRRTGTARFIGMPEASQAAMKAAGVTVVPSAQPTCVLPGVWVTGAIPRRHVDASEAHLVLDVEGRQTDPLDDDQAVVVDTMHGLAVICGCAHAGIVNTLDLISEVRPNVSFALVVGGLHLGSADPAAISRIGECLLKRRVGRCILGHCTGERAKLILTEQLGDKLTTLTCGSRLEIP